MQKIKIYHIVLYFCFFILVYATHSIEDCNEDDFECLEDFMSDTKQSAITLSSSSFGEPYSTVLAAYISDSMSDFHEAKLANQKSKTPEIVNQPEVIVQDINNVNDVHSEIDSTTSTTTTGNTSGLSNVEAGVLSACGVLVVGGIAVGIFVWRNQQRSQDQSVVISQQNYHGDNGDIAESQNYKLEIDEKDYINYREQEATNSIMSNRKSNYKGFKQGERGFRSVINFSLPDVDEENGYSNSVISEKFERNMFTSEDRAQHVPSALNPLHDPTSLTQPLQKFLLKSPLSCKSSNENESRFQNTTASSSTCDPENEIRLSALSRRYLHSPIYSTHIPIHLNTDADSNSNIENDKDTTTLQKDEEHQ